MDFHLAPGTSATIDVKQIFAQGLPDKNGSRIPADMAEGSVMFSNLAGADKPLTLVTSLAVYNVANATCGGGTCYCCGYGNFSLNPANFVIAIGQQMPCVCHATDCTGAIVTLSSGGVWSSSNTAIMTVSTSGTVTGVAAGQANISDFFSSIPIIGACSISPCPTNSVTVVTGGTVQVPTQVEPIATLQQGSAVCPAGEAGWSRKVTNQLEDQFGGKYKVGGIQMADTISYPQANAFGLNGTVTGSASTDSNGTWPDSYFVCTTACPTSTSEVDAGQSWTFNGLGLPHTNLVAYKCSSITVDGH